MHASEQPCAVRVGGVRYPCCTRAGEAGARPRSRGWQLLLAWGALAACEARV